MNQLLKLNTKHLVITIILLFSLTSCDDFVKIDPPRTDLTKTTVFEDDGTATAAVLDVYYQMVFQGFSSGNVTSFSFLGSLASDEQLTYFISDPKATLEVKQFNDNKVVANNEYLLRLWQDNYKYIYKVNAIIEGLSLSMKVSENLKKQLIGEAKFIRAFAHFYLVNLWGDVPLVTTTDYRTNDTASRASEEKVYEQIIADLKEAQEFLSSDYSSSNNERVRVNKGAATALLARVYLYRGDWTNAEIESTAVISNTDLYNIAPSLTEVFNRNNTEAIWQLWSSARPKERTTFRFLAEPIFGALRDEFVAAFEAGDNRGTDWVFATDFGYYSSFKYFSSALNPPTQYSTVLRLAEQYLIRAEARAQLNKISGSQEDINVIRQRAGLGDTPATDKESLLLAIEQERRSEFFTEWGHRWFDLKRTGRADAVLSPIKPEWKSTAVLLPIPESEIISNPSLKQNPGY